MNRTTRRLLSAAALLGGGVVATRMAEKVAADRLRSRLDESLDDLYELPDDVERHDVPTHDGGSVHVVEAGEGRPLVLVHGVTLAAEIWAPVFHLAADRYRIIAIDVRGHGRSVVGSEGVGRLRAARDLAGVLEHFDLRDAVLAGHSMGGMIIGELAGAHPEVVDQRVGGLVFCATATSDLVAAPIRRPVLAGAGRLAERSRRGRPLPALSADRNLLASRLAFGARPSGAALAQVSRLGLAVDPTLYMPLWADLLDLDTRDALAGVQKPATVLVGSRDLLTPVAAAKRIVNALPDAELHVLPGAGHQLMQERPFELVGHIDRLVDRIEAA